MEPSPYAGAQGGGAGGKIRRRPAARSAVGATPYDRPPAAAAAHRLAAAAAAVGEGGGWLSKLVDPASRLIAGGAARLLSSVFRKRHATPALPPPTVAPEGNNQSTQDIPEATHSGLSPGILERGDKGKSVDGTSGDKTLSEVEHLLMRKTFTRVEFDRLTDLLRSRTVESDLPQSLVHQEEKYEVDTSARRDGMGDSILHEISSNRSASVDVPLGGGGSPTELAKQYMTSRYLRGSPPTSHVFLADKAEPSSAAYVKRRSGASLVPKSAKYGNENPDVSENGYATPSLRGRSAMYRMSRSPFFKGSSSSHDMNLAPFSLSQTLTQSLHTGGRQVLKRKNSDLENQLGSVGPIRRIRQKSNMMSPFKGSHASPQQSPLPGLTSRHDIDAIGNSSSVQESPSLNKLFAESGQLRQPLEPEENVQDGKYRRDSVPSEPPQSNKVAKKIFEQLNIIAPPKDKQSGSQSAGREGKHSMLTAVQQGPGLSIAKDSTGSLDPGLTFSPSTKDMLTEDRSQKVPSAAVKLTSQDHSRDAVKSDYCDVDERSAILGNSNSDGTAPSRKPGFKMAVFEDLSEPDDDQEASIPSKNAVSKVELNSVDKLKSKTTEQNLGSDISERKIDLKVSEQKVASKILEEVRNPPTTGKRRLVFPSKDIPSSNLVSSNGSEENAASPVRTDNSTDFTFPVGSSSSRSEPPPTPIIPGLSPAMSTKKNEQTTAAAFTFGLKQSSTLASETSTAPVKADTRLNESVANSSVMDNSNSNRGNQTKKAEGPSNPSSTATSSTVPTFAAAAPFSFSTSASPSLSNGFPHSSSPKFSFTAVSDAPPEKSTDNLALSTTMTSVAVFSSSSPISSAVPAFPTLSFGSCASTGSQMAPADKSDGKNVEAKPAHSMSFGTRSTMTEGKAALASSASLSNLFTSSASSSMATFSSPVTSSSTLSSIATFSSPDKSSGARTVASMSASSTTSTTSSTMAGLQSAPATSFAFSSSGNTTFGFNPPVQSGLNTSIADSTSLPSSAFGTEPGAGSGALQLSQSSATQSSPPFLSVTFGPGSSTSGSGIMTFGSGTSSSGSGTVTFGSGTSSSGSGVVTFGAGTSSSGSGPVTFGAGTSSSQSGPMTFGAGTSSPVSATATFAAGTSFSPPGMVTFGAGSSSSGSAAVTFGSGTSSGSGTMTFGAGTSSSGSRTVVFGAGTSASSSLFGSGASFSNPFGSSSGSGFSFASPSSAAASSLTVASTNVFSSTSVPSSSSVFSNTFGSSSSPPSVFTFGQSASSGSGFTFATQSAPVFLSQSSPVFSSQPASVFTFNSGSAGMNSSTPQPSFGIANANVGFGMGSTGNDQMSMEDSMADDTSQPVSAPAFGASPFGQPAGSPAAPVFGALPAQPGGVFQFGSHQGSLPQNPSFPAAGSLEFQGGNFSLGSGGGGGGDKSNRRVIRVKKGKKK